jgi:hypothetical protein
MADATPARHFVMHGARDAMAAGLTHIEQQVTSIEAAISDNVGLAFDLSKTLIESVCKTILSEREISFPPNDDLQHLFRLVTRNLPFLPAPAAAEAEVRKSLVKTLAGLNTAVQGVCELRNACGFASHGSSEKRPQLETIQALLAAETADAVVGFLYKVHTQDRTTPIETTSQYEDNPDFNTYIDELHDRILIFQEEFEPSKVLFQLAPEPYKIYLAEHAQNLANNEMTEVVPDSGVNK